MHKVILTMSICCLLLVFCGCRDSKTPTNEKTVIEEIPEPNQAAFQSMESKPVGDRLAIRQKDIVLDGEKVSEIKYYDHDGNGETETVLQSFKVNRKIICIITSSDIENWPKTQNFYSMDDVEINHGTYAGTGKNLLIVQSDKHRLFWVFVQNKTGEYIPADQLTASMEYSTKVSSPGARAARKLHAEKDDLRKK